ncbi:hypothetical protein [Catellatospora vulcania]|uniref:hypothetical protein n=1 Tax=Catellatospora vulcania TaxID=1460450 RepID=UPI0012D3E029|nr:hypothetical protein [Catellatospora vulcania]
MWTPLAGNQPRQYRKMPAAQRLFLQRWIEMLSPEVDFRWRLRPVSDGLLRKELAAVETTGADKRRLNGSTLYAALLDEEWQATPKVMFERLTAEQVQADPAGSAQRMAHGLILAGYSPQTLLGAQRILLNGQRLQDQLDELQHWHAKRTTARPFRLAVPVVRGGTMIKSFGWTQPYFDTLEPAFQRIVVAAETAGHAARTPRYLLAEVTANDPTAAAMNFLEHFDRYQLQLRPPNRPLTIGHEMVIVHDEYPAPQGRTVRFPMPPRFAYEPPEAIDGRMTQRVMDAAKTDPVIHTLLLQYLMALRELARGSVRDAFQALLPLLDIGFECDEGPWAQRTAFARTIEIAAILLAVQTPRALFRHLQQYLRRPCPAHARSDRGPWATGDDAADLALLTGPRWPELAAVYEWNGLLAQRRAELLRLVTDPRPAVPRTRRTARWDMARAVRARHAFAHRGEPMTDAYGLSVALEAAYLCLVARCAAVERGISFAELVTRLDAATGANPAPLNWPLLVAEGEWALARSVS